ncbi:MAG: DNA polymerase Y family protein [bacterium]
MTPRSRPRRGATSRDVAPQVVSPELAGERVACVSLPAFPLQIVRRAHPDWTGDPVVVVEDDRPTSRVRYANREARALRIRPGTRFAQAQSLAARVHGVVVDDLQIAEAVEEIFLALLEHCPRVEPAADCPGLYWLDPNGLEALFGSTDTWADRVHDRLLAQGWMPAVVVGWQRSFTFALARSRTGVCVTSDPGAERRDASAVPLTRLDLPPSLRDALRKLDVRTVGELLALPCEGLRVRWGTEAATLHELLSGRAWRPFHPQLPVEPWIARIPVDPPDDDPSRLLFGMKNVLHELAAKLEHNSEGIVAVGLDFTLDHAPPHRERIETAGPTLDVMRLLDLVRLRLSGISLAAPVEEIELRLETRRVHAHQLALIKSRPRRDPVAAAKALARVQAAFGRGSVVRAEPADGHLPEQRFRWVARVDLPVARPVAEDPMSSSSDPSPLVRSLLPVPRPLPDVPAHEKETWLGRHGAVERLLGPDRIATGWWAERTERDYYFAETKTGEILWIFFDRAERRWYLHGIVD